MNTPIWLFLTLFALGASLTILAILSLLFHAKQIKIQMTILDELYNANGYVCTLALRQHVANKLRCCISPAEFHHAAGGLLERGKICRSGNHLKLA